MFTWAASGMGKHTDSTLLLIGGICVALLAIITLTMLYFVIRYGRGRHPVAVNIDGNAPLEAGWTALSIVLVLFLFYMGWSGYRDLKVEIPKGAVTVKANARQWHWIFEYENGMQSDTLNVPLNKPVLIRINSQDVLHGFFIPAFRVKQDAVPGSEKTAWFVPDTEGTYDLFCTQYCGVGHSAMITKVSVMAEDKFSEWMKAGTAVAIPKTPEELAARGKELYTSKGCSVCHTLDGTRLVGPSLKDLYRSRVKVTTSGKEREIVADEEYIRRSEFDPNADIVAGYPPVMPSSKGLLSEDDVKAVIEFLKTLSAKAPKAAEGERPAVAEKAPEKPPAGGSDLVGKGRELYTSKGCSACHSIDGTKIVGPTWKGLYGSRVKVMTGGKERDVVADDEYIRRSEIDPNADLVVGYPAIMPSSKGVVSDEEIKAIIEYIKTLR